MKPLLNVKENQLKPAILNYFRKLDSLVENKSDEIKINTKEELNSLISNVFAESKGCQEALLLNRHTSFTLEKVFNLATDVSKLKAFTSAILDRFLVLSRGRNSSHPLQALLKKWPEILEEEYKKGQRKPIRKSIRIVKRILSDFSKNFKILLDCPHGTFVARDLIELSFTFYKWLERVKAIHSLRNKNVKKPKRISKNKNPLVKRIIAEIVNQPVKNLYGLCLSKTASPVLTAVVKNGTKNLNEPTGRLRKKIIALKTPPNALSLMAKDPTASFLLQSLCENANNDEIDRICESLQSKFLGLSRDPIGNHVVRSLLLNENLNRDHFKALFDEITPGMNFDKTNLIPITLARRSIKFSGHQEEIYSSYKTALEAKNDADLMLKLFFKGERIDLKGCEILKALIQFDYKTVNKLVQAFRELSDPKLVYRLATDKNGSDVLTAFLYRNWPKYNAAKLAKRKLIQRLKRHYSKLACDRFGNSVIECCLLYGSLKQKKEIGRELCSSLYTLNGNKYGQRINEAYRISEFAKEIEGKEEPKEWLKFLENRRIK